MANLRQKKLDGQLVKKQNKIVQLLKFLEITNIEEKK